MKKLIVVLLILPVVAMGQDAPYECDNNYGECGTPETSGGGAAGGGSWEGLFTFATPSGDICRGGEEQMVARHGKQASERENTGHDRVSTESETWPVAGGSAKSIRSMMDGW